MNDIQIEQFTNTVASETSRRASHRGLTFQSTLTPHRDDWQVRAEIDGLSMSVHFTITGRGHLSAADFNRELMNGFRREVDHYWRSISAALACLDRCSPHPALFTSETEV
jgi:hypothetical protein